MPSASPAPRLRKVRSVRRLAYDAVPRKLTMMCLSGSQTPKTACVSVSAFVSEMRPVSPVGSNERTGSSSRVMRSMTGEWKPRMKHAMSRRWQPHAWAAEVAHGVLRLDTLAGSEWRGALVASAGSSLLGSSAGFSATSATALSLVPSAALSLLFMFS